MADAGARYGTFRRRGRGLTIHQFAAFVIGASLLMLVTGIVLEFDSPLRGEASETADSELEAMFAPAAGRAENADEAGAAGSFSLRQKLRQRY